MIYIYCRLKIGVGLLGRAMAMFDDHFKRRLTDVNGEFTVEVPVQSQAKKAETKLNESCPDTPKRENMVQARNEMKAALTPQRGKTWCKLEMK